MSDWSSDVCSSDLAAAQHQGPDAGEGGELDRLAVHRFAPFFQSGARFGAAALHPDNRWRGVWFQKLAEPGMIGGAQTAPRSPPPTPPPTPLCSEIGRATGRERGGQDG